MPTQGREPIFCTTTPLTRPRFDVNASRLNRADRSLDHSRGSFGPRPGLFATRLDCGRACRDCCCGPAFRLSTGVPLGWIALVPLLLLGPARPAPAAHGARQRSSPPLCRRFSSCNGCATATRACTWRMIACAFYFALYFPAFLLLCRGRRAPPARATRDRRSHDLGRAGIFAGLYAHGSFVVLHRAHAVPLARADSNQRSGRRIRRQLCRGDARPAALAGIVPAWCVWLSPNAVRLLGRPANAESEAAIEMMVDGGIRGECVAPACAVPRRAGRGLCPCSLWAAASTYGYVRRAQAEFHEGSADRARSRETSPRP